MPSDRDNVRLARIDEKVTSLDKVIAAHLTDDAGRFERTFEYMKERFDKTDLRYDRVDGKMEVVYQWVISNKDVPDKLSQLWDEKNRQQGAFSIGRIAAAALGGLLVAVADFFANWKH